MGDLQGAIADWSRPRALGSCLNTRLNSVSCGVGMPGAGEGRLCFLRCLHRRKGARLRCSSRIPPGCRRAGLRSDANGTARCRGITLRAGCDPKGPVESGENGFKLLRGEERRRAAAEEDGLVSRRAVPFALHGDLPSERREEIFYRLDTGHRVEVTVVALALAKRDVNVE